MVYFYYEKEDRGQDFKGLDQDYFDDDDKKMEVGPMVEPSSEFDLNEIINDLPPLYFWRSGRIAMKPEELLIWAKGFDATIKMGPSPRSDADFFMDFREGEEELGAIVSQIKDKAKREGYRLVDSYSSKSLGLNRVVLVYRDERRERAAVQEVLNK